VPRPGLSGRTIGVLCERSDAAGLPCAATVQVEQAQVPPQGDCRDPVVHGLDLAAIAEHLDDAAREIVSGVVDAMMQIASRQTGIVMIEARSRTMVIVLIGAEVVAVVDAREHRPRGKHDVPWGDTSSRRRPRDRDHVSPRSLPLRGLRVRRGRFLRS